MSQMVLDIRTLRTVIYAKKGMALLMALAGDDRARQFFADKRILTFEAIGHDRVLIDVDHHKFEEWDNEEEVK